MKISLKNYYSLDFYKTTLQDEHLYMESELCGMDKEAVLHLEYDSRKVIPGTLFVCKGANFKDEYLVEAIRRGAIGYIATNKIALDMEIPYILVTDIRESMVILAELFYNHPQEKLTIIGIGGTKGKTITTFFVKSILDHYLKSQGRPPAGLISSITNFSGLEEEESQNTTPEAMDLQRFLADCVEYGLEYVVMEVSSQALKYHRTDRVFFDVSIFLNIDEDHISPVEHENFEDYLNSKAIMFHQTKNLIINKETKEANYLLERAKEAEHFYTFSVKSADADYYADAIETVDLKSNFWVHTKNINEKIKLAMPGQFNVENAVASIAATDILGVPIEFAAKALKETYVPGRMRIFSSNDKKIIAVVDFAHNRLSFKSLITSMIKTYPDYRVVSVFGAPGGKALGRREELGRIAGKYSNYVYITMEDPGPEKVEDISKQIATYVQDEGTDYTIVLDRTEAIKTAFKDVKENTVILVIGKGHENSMNICGEYVPIRLDEEIVSKLMTNYNKNINK